jgi:alpha-glucosidase
MAIQWWQKGIVYQIYPRSFMDSNNDGVGDLQGIINQLDYLADLGVDAIWISPFYPSPMADFGYDVADYCDVDPLFGDLRTFDNLVAESHKRGIKLIVDYVPNHSSNQHKWFLESKSSRENLKKDWYIWRDAKADGSLPNNWGSMFGGPAWTWDEERQQYYFHQFAPEQPDLNWRNPEVKAAMFDVLRFWMKRGGDGFRMDVVYMIWKHPDMPDHPIIEGAKGRNENDIIGRQQSLYNYNYEGVHDVMREMRAVLDEFGTIAIAEVWLDLQTRLEYYKTFEMPFNFDFIGDSERYQWNADFFQQTVERMEAALASDAWPNYVLGSHDMPRLASRYGSDARARLAALLLLTLRGTPTLYMGDEIGMLNGEISESQLQDPQGKVLGLAYTRDVCRTPMQWDGSAYAGFSRSETWLPVNKDYPTRNVKNQLADKQSILNLYRQLIAYRRQHPSLNAGSYQSIEAPEGVYAYLRESDGEKHLIALNFTTEAKTLLLPAEGEIVLSTGLERSGKLNKNLELAGDEGLLIRLI